MFDWLLQRLAPARGKPRALTAAFCQTLPPLDALDDSVAEPILGCGWFDSSHDLRAGLVVQEHASADAVSEALGLAAWLELHLREWRGRLAQMRVELATLQEPLASTDVTERTA